LLRILHIDTGPELRGGQRQLLLLARGLRERGHHQLIACTEQSPLAARARLDGFRVAALGPGVSLLAALRGLRRAVVQERFQVLHAHDGRSQTLSALASLGLDVKRVATRRVTFMPPSLGPRVGLHRLQYGPTCDAVVAVSGFIRNLLIRSGIAGAKVEVIRDGIEIPAALPDPAGRARAREHWGLDPRAFVVGHVGAFTPEKGQDVLLEAFLRAMPCLPAGAQLLLAGDGPELVSPRVTALVGKARDRVRMPGWVEDLALFFAALDLYVMPSRAEGLGSSALLAMAYGLPVLASRVGGLPEVVEDGHTGWLVPPDSPAALADVMAHASSDPQGLSRFGAHGRERAAAFSSDIMIRRTESRYLRLTSRGALSPG
jgi:glycosyltransferase involved in cell wall biosynthesis